MELTRRGFLCGLLAGLGVILTGKLPKAGTPKKVSRQIIGKNAVVTWAFKPETWTLYSSTRTDARATVFTFEDIKRAHAS